MLMENRTPAVGVIINYRQPPDGAKVQLTSDDTGLLPGAVCPVCGEETVHVYEAFRANLGASLAGVQTKVSAEHGWQLACANVECDAPQSEIVTFRQPKGSFG